MSDKTEIVSDTDEHARKIAEEDYAVKGNDLSGFKGVSPEYMTYASDTEKPVAKKSSAKKSSAKKQDESSAEAPKSPAQPQRPAPQS